MRARGDLTCRQHYPAPSRTALEIIDHIRQVLEQGCTPEQVAQAQADLQAPRTLRQSQLPLKVRS